MTNLRDRGSLTRQTGNALARRAPRGEAGNAKFERRSKQQAAANNATAQAVEGNLGGFCLWPWLRSTETAPARTACRGRSCRNSGWVDHEEVSPTELVEAAVERIEKHRIRPTISETQAMPNPKSIKL